MSQAKKKPVWLYIALGAGAILVIGVVAVQFLEIGQAGSDVPPPVELPDSLQ
ncbi:MAG: hypothetical protein AAFO83_00905 [Cyanobacteria bacterium J06607_13]